MAQLKDTIVTGDLSVTGTIYGDIPLDNLTDADDLKAIEALTGTSGVLTKTAANTWTLASGTAPASHTHGNITNAGAIGTAANKGVYTGTNGVLTAGTIPVAAGGTGAASFTANSIIISGSSTTAALTTRAITNITAKNNLGWTSAGGTNIPTLNTLACWNGRYNASSSNLEYCSKGAFGSMATASTNDYIAKIEKSSFALSSTNPSATQTYTLSTVNDSNNRLYSDIKNTFSTYGATFTDYSIYNKSTVNSYTRIRNLNFTDGTSAVQIISSASEIPLLNPGDNTVLKSVRNIYISTNSPSGGMNGDIWLKYTS